MSASEELIFWRTDWPERREWHATLLDILALPEVPR